MKKNIVAKKSFGQNFLKNPGVIRKIVETGEVKEGDVVLEIGPGKGALTAELLKSGATVFAIEKDFGMKDILEETFEKEIKNKKLKIIFSDFLTEDIEKIIPKNKSFKVIANIPYYITGAIIEKTLSEKRRPNLAVFLVQKEVAERIIARDKKESILSLSVKVFGIPKIIMTVSRNSFFPAPKVDSAILKISNIKNNFNKNFEKNFFALVKNGFAHKRKFVLKNI
ncbi:MAG: ribosomal RNA small subunit methyltransferase A, partial [Candidatus Pacebacteria bacterium]|nr:ribosomal RNA small subunit methyltransferase A [Candidatus Paceibacterota bacterium]